MLALIKDNEQIVGQFAEGGWFTLPNGDTASPAYNGWENDDGLKLVTIADGEPTPEGYVFTSRTLQMINGVPTWVNEFEELPPPIIIVYAVHFWERMTDEEAEMVDEAMMSQPLRLRKIFQSANSFRSDNDLWPLLNQLALQLFGKERADQILAPSEYE